MTAKEERIDLDPLDVPLSRRDVLDLLHELTKARGPIAGYNASGEVRHRSEVALQANALEQHFRHEWSKRPKPEKLDVTESEAHDAE